MEEEKKNDNAQKQQQFVINQSTYLDDESANLNIEDVDLPIKYWSKCIATGMLFMKSILVLPKFHQVKNFIIINYNTYIILNLKCNIN